MLDFCCYSKYRNMWCVLSQTEITKMYYASLSLETSTSRVESIEGSNLRATYRKFVGNPSLVCDFVWAEART